MVQPISSVQRGFTRTAHRVFSVGRRCRMTTGLVKNAGRNLVLLTCLCFLASCMTSTYERLRIQPSSTEITIQRLTQISASALKNMDYQIRTIHDTGYVLGDRPIAKPISRYSMSVWIVPEPDGKKHVKVTCKGHGCFDCKEQEEVKLFFELFDKIAEIHGLAGSVAMKQRTEDGVLPTLKRSVASPKKRGSIKQKRLGLSVQELTPELKVYMKISQDTEGVLVTEVLPGSIGSLMDLRRGDIITQVNQTSVDVPGDLAIVDRLSSRFVDMTVIRNSETVTKRVDLRKTPTTHEVTPLSQMRSSEGKSPSTIIDIHHLAAMPPKISPGSAFDLIIEYTVMDTTVEAESIPIKVSYRISDGEKVFLSKPVEMISLNGKRMTQTLHLTAAKKRGSFHIECLFNYNNEVWKRSTQLKIE